MPVPVSAASPEIEAESVATGSEVSKVQRASVVAPWDTPDKADNATVVTNASKEFIFIV